MSLTNINAELQSVKEALELQIEYSKSQDERNADFSRRIDDILKIVTHLKDQSSDNAAGQNDVNQSISAAITNPAYENDEETRCSADGKFPIPFEYYEYTSRPVQGEETSYLLYSIIFIYLILCDI